jgi:hypothetical protein
MFLLNHTTVAQKICLPAGYVNLLEDKTLGRQVTMAPNDVIILSAQE